MKWYEGDVWRADIEVNPAKIHQLEYKYVVCNSDGTVEAWKPGENFHISVPSTIGKISVNNWWDGGQSVEFEEVQLPRQDVSQAAAYSGTADLELALANAQVVSGTSVADIDEKTVVALAETNAFLELKSTLLESIDIMDRPGYDATSPEVIAQDRQLAAIQRRAEAMKKALAAADPTSKLRLLKSSD